MLGHVTRREQHVSKGWLLSLCHGVRGRGKVFNGGQREAIGITHVTDLEERGSLWVLDRKRIGMSSLPQAPYPAKVCWDSIVFPRLPTCFQSTQLTAPHTACSIRQSQRTLDVCVFSYVCTFWCMPWYGRADSPALVILFSLFKTKLTQQHSTNCAWTVEHWRTLKKALQSGWNTCAYASAENRFRLNLWFLYFKRNDWGISLHCVVTHKVWRAGNCTETHLSLRESCLRSQWSCEKNLITNDIEHKSPNTLIRTF